MAVMTSKLFTNPVGTHLLDAVRRFSRGSQDVAERLERVVPDAAPAPVQMTELSADQSRYARLLEHELDRQLLSEVEREDSEMLARVRDALYADD